MGSNFKYQNNKYILRIPIQKVDISVDLHINYA